ncbi:MAG: CapA family protein [Lachnospiraceae bacterium]|nr:CapA family protein [Lachnospiraceae bacterium]
MRKILVCIMALVGTGAVLYMLWMNGTFLPRWIRWESGISYDSSEKYEIILAQKKVSVEYDNGVIWASPKGVKVQSVLSADIDGDKMEEMILLCWKIGRYGRSKPFWVEEDEKKWSQHIFVYGLHEGKVRPKWMSSYIGQDVSEMAVKGQAQQAEHIMRVPRNRLLLTAPDGRVNSWIWDSWGFKKETTEVSFVAFGDNLIHEPIYRYGLHNDGNFDFLFENIKETITKSDIAVINQETPLTDDPAMYGDYPRFGTPAQVGDAIADAGFDVVTCATNHALDRGMAGIDFTKKFFGERDIICLGIQSVEEKEYKAYDIIVRNGIRFVMLNYTYGTNGIGIPEEAPDSVHLLADEERIREDIGEAKAQSDVVIIFAHWGTEYEEEPDDFQKKWAEIFLESGVDVVVGTHPHALQPYEVLRDDSGHEMLVYYSVGNYISAQPEQSCVKGGMAEFTVSLTADGYAITEYNLRPLAITWQEGGKCTVDFAQP